MKPLLKVTLADSEKKNISVEEFGGFGADEIRNTIYEREDNYYSSDAFEDHE